MAKRLRLKKATCYRAPKYPVMDDGRVVSTPKELRLGELALGLAKPFAPIVMSAGLAATDASASTVRTPPAAVLNLAGSPAVQEKEQGPYRVRTFSKEEVQALIKELQIEYRYPENVRGEPSLQMPPLTEAQGRTILHRFFSKNQIRLRDDVRFQKDGVDFVADAYDPDRRIGYEFIPVTGENDLTEAEIAKLNGERILLLRDKRDLPNPEGVVRRLAEAAQKYLAKLYADGVLGRTAEIERHLKDYLAGNDRAGAELENIGPEALWWLRKADAKRAEPVIRGIYEKHIRPALEALNEDDLDVRNAATERLIGFGPAVIPYVEAHLAQSKGVAEVALRCEMILKELR